MTEEGLDAEPRADDRDAVRRRKERREWLIAGAVVIGVFFLLALLSYQSGRAERLGGLSGLAWSYLQTVTALVLVYAIFALGLNLEFGYTGLINFGHVAFMSVGAYTAAIIAWRAGPAIYDVSAPVAAGWVLLILLVSTVVAVAFSLILGLPTLRLREDYLAIVTIGFAEIVRIAALNEEWLTNGPRGIRNRMPGSDWIIDEQTGFAAFTQWLNGTVLRIDLDPYFTFLILVGSLALAILWAVFELLVRSPWGRVLKAIREDEDLASALGKNVFMYKLQSLALGSFAAAVAGILFAWYQRFITPGNFLPVITFYAWIALVVGGVGNNKGALVGASLLWGVFEIARQLRLGTLGIAAAGGALQIVVVGVLLILIMMFRPQGVMGRREEMLFAR